MSEEESGSFAETPSPKTKKPPTTDASVPLFKLMGEIRDAIKENTEAMNSLLTTLIGQKRVEFSDSQGKTTITTSIEPTPLPEPTSEETTKPEATELEQIKMMFPEDLENLLNFTDEGEYIKVKPRQFLGSEYFAKIASVIRAAGGEYVSAGKESHFRIPKK